MSKAIKDILEKFYLTVEKWEALDTNSKQAIINEALSQIKKIVEGKKVKCAIHGKMVGFGCNRCVLRDEINKALDDIVKELEP